MRVVRPHVGAEREELLGDRHRRRLAPVARSGLVREPDDQDARSVHRSALPVQHRDDAADDVLGHSPVDLVGELHEPEAVTELALDTPREVRRIDRQAMPAGSRTGGEPHEAVGLGARRVDRRPDVDAEVAGEHRELVDERDVDVAERVLEQLGELGFARGRDGDDLVDDAAVEVLDDCE